MRVVCDVHISFKVVRFLVSKGVEAIHVNNILQGDISTDSSIADFADEGDYVVMTKDADFQNSHFVLRKPQKLLKINLGNISTQRLLEILDKNWDAIAQHFEHSPCMVELGDGLMRVFD